VAAVAFLQLNFMISFKSAAKKQQNTGLARPKKQRPCFLKPENYSIQNSPASFYIELCFVN